jgi:MFS family permease
MSLYPRRWQALAVLATSLLVISLGNTILNVALPMIPEQLDASSSELQWIVDGYMLVSASLLLAAEPVGRESSLCSPARLSASKSCRHVASFTA